MFASLTEPPRKRGTPRWMRNAAILAVSVEVTLTLVWLAWRAWRRQKTKFDS